jgi:hypothetical protein
MERAAQGQLVRNGAESRHPGKYEPSISRIWTLNLKRWLWVGETPRLHPSKGAPLLELRARAPYSLQQPEVSPFSIPRGSPKTTTTPSSPSHPVPHPHRCPKKLVVDSIVEGGCEFAGVRVHSRSLAMRVVNGWVSRSITWSLA